MSNGSLTCRKSKDSESFGACKHTQTAQADIGRYFRKCIKPPFHRTWLTPGLCYVTVATIS